MEDGKLVVVVVVVKVMVVGDPLVSAALFCVEVLDTKTSRYG